MALASWQTLRIIFQPHADYDADFRNTIRIYTTTTYEEPQYVVTYKKGDSWQWTDLNTIVADGIITFTINTIFTNKYSDVTYNLLGQKVRTWRGLIIKNGKKYIKEGKKVFARLAEL